MPVSIDALVVTCILSWPDPICTFFTLCVGHDSPGIVEEWQTGARSGLGRWVAYPMQQGMGMLPNQTAKSRTRG